MSRTSLVLCLLALGLGAAGLIACGSSSEETGGEITGEGEGVGETGAAPRGSQGETPAAARALRMQQDLLDIAHLADIEHHGLYVDFGTPARMKYTIGHWRTGWGSDGADGDETFTNATDAARVYFPMRESAAITMRIRIKAIGSRRLQIFVNNRSLPEGISLAEGAEFRDYDVAIPADMIRAGENALLLRFGGTTRVGDENVAAAVSSIRFVPGTPAEGERFLAPDLGALVAQTDVGGTERRALAVRAPTTLSYHVEIPRGARLVFGVGGEGEVAGGRARVVVHPEGGEATEVYSAALTNRWDDQSIDLSRFQGQVARIELIGEASAAAGAESGRVAWSVPALMVPPPQVAQTQPVRNVVVLLIDTLRASKLRPYNPQSRVQTPVLDRIASEGTLFERAQSQENWTKPSVASVLTGLTPMTHGTKTDAARLSADAEMVSEVFDGAGFATAMFSANGYVSDRFGFDQGWDHYTNYIRENRSTEAENVFTEAGNFIEQHSSERFFVYIQTIDPHVPYDPPAEFLSMYDSRTDYAGQVRNRMTGDLLERAKRNPPTVTFDASDRRRLEALHDGEISYHDAQLGRFLERLSALGHAEDTLVVITSDHGEEFNEHGSWGHGHSVYQELLGVPLIFWRPGTVPVQRVAHTVSTVSISPTVLQLTGIDGLRRAEGRSLVPDLRGEVLQGPQVAFSDFLDDRRVIRAGRWKLILRGHNPTMFDLESDPGEQRELDMNDHPIAGRYLRVMIGQYLGAADRGNWLSATQQARGAVSGVSTALDAETCAQLRAMGYVPDCTGVEGAATTLGQTD
ncbi:MAG: sulfatase-like hydrolase/transferase [Myxococcota bacterium]|nr:sulfatase-like hydrolase/transferase [Myxococcota bacterium]